MIQIQALKIVLRVSLLCACNSKLTTVTDIFGFATTWRFVCACTRTRTFKQIHMKSTRAKWKIVETTKMLACFEYSENAQHFHVFYIVRYTRDRNANTDTSPKNKTNSSLSLSFDVKG